MKTKIWGYEIALDLIDVDLEIIKNPDEIRRYVKELLTLIDMTPYGETILHHFGNCPEVEGYTMMQMIETSLISAHFVEASSCAYINCFSCKEFDFREVEKFSRQFFNARRVYINKLYRFGK